MPPLSEQQFLEGRNWVSSIRLGDLTFPPPHCLSLQRPTLLCAPQLSVTTKKAAGHHSRTPSPSTQPWHYPFPGSPLVAPSPGSKQHIHHLTNRCLMRPTPDSPTAGAKWSVHAYMGGGGGAAWPPAPSMAAQSPQLDQAMAEGGEVHKRAHKSPPCSTNTNSKPWLALSTPGSNLPAAWPWVSLLSSLGLNLLSAWKSIPARPATSAATLQPGSFWKWNGNRLPSHLTACLQGQMRPCVWRLFLNGGSLWLQPTA